MRKDDDWRVGFEPLQVLFEPSGLIFPNDRLRVRNVVDDDEVYAFMIECIVEFAEVLLVGITPVERRIVLAGHKVDCLDVEPRDYVSEL